MTARTFLAVASDSTSALPCAPAARLAGVAWRGAAFCALTLLLSIASSHAFAPTSDGATVVLEGDAIRHGHLGLAGWTFAYDSFWSIDALAYALGVALVGIRPELMHAIPAAIAAAVILTASHAAGIGLCRVARVISVVLVVGLLALPSHALAFFFLQGPWHVGTALYCLAAFCCLRHEGYGWRWVAGIVLLAGAVLGDLQAVAFGVVPVFGAGLVAMARQRVWRSGLALMSAAPASVGLAIAIRVVATKLGAFAVVSGHRTAGAAVMAKSIANAWQWTGALLGVDRGPFGGPPIPPLVEGVHLLGAVVVIIGVCGAVVTLVRTTTHPRSEREPELRLEQCLLFACVGDFVAFEFLALSSNPLYARYLTAAVLFATVLGARLAGRLGAWLAAELRRAPRMVARRAVMACCVLGVGGAFTAYVSDLLIDTAQALPHAPARDLTALLASHKLDRGLGEYWGASIVTVESRGAIHVRPVVADGRGVIKRDGHQSSTEWYDGATFHFLVYERLPYGRITPTSIRKTYGTPAHTYTVDQYSVDVWTDPIGVSNESVP